MGGAEEDGMDSRAFLTVMVGGTGRDEKESRRREAAARELAARGMDCGGDHKQKRVKCA